MTPEEAKQLRDKATPAPWKAYDLESHPDTDTYIVGPDGERVAGSPESGYGVAHRNQDLIIAAHDLAETVIQQDTKIKRLQHAIHYLDGHEQLDSLTEFNILKDGDLE